MRMGFNCHARLHPCRRLPLYPVLDNRPLCPRVRPVRVLRLPQPLFPSTETSAEELPNASATAARRVLLPKRNRQRKHSAKAVRATDPWRRWAWPESVPRPVAVAGEAERATVAADVRAARLPLVRGVRLGRGRGWVGDYRIRTRLAVQLGEVQHVDVRLFPCPTATDGFGDVDGWGRADGYLC